MDQLKKEQHVTDALYLDHFQVQQNEQTAIATYYSVSNGSKKGIPFQENRMRWFDVGVKQWVQWKWIASQQTWVNHY